MKVGSTSAFLLTVMLLSACNGNMRANSGSGSLPNVEYGANGTYSRDGYSADSQQFAQTNAQVNMAHEQAVAVPILEAWRKAVGDPKKGIAGDEKTAMEMLEKLDKEHPDISTVQFMMGQVEDHFGKHAEAVEHFKKAHSINKFSSIQTYKLAESLRKAGKPDQAITYYSKLVENLERATNDYGRDEAQLLVSVRMGLAHAYAENKNNDKAKAEIEKVLKIAPDNKDANELAKTLK